MGQRKKERGGGKQKWLGGEKEKGEEEGGKGRNGEEGGKSHARGLTLLDDEIE